MGFKTWASWEVVEWGSGTVTLSAGDTVASCVDGGSSDKAYLQRRITVSPGDIVSVSVLASVASGAPSLIIDYPAPASPKITVEMVGSDLRLYSALYQVPDTADASDFVYLNVGVFTTDAGECTLLNYSVVVNGTDIDVVDGIKESGSGANGTYTMWSDGRMEQEKIVELTDCASAWGSVFTSGLTNIGSFEKTFVGDWDFTATANGSASGGKSAWAYSNNSQVGVVRGTSATGTFYVLVRAVGRWK